MDADAGKTRLVRRDSKSGFTLYADAGALKEAAAIASGDVKNSVILSTAEKLAHDPLAAPKAVVGEVAALVDGTPKNSAVEAALDTVDSLVSGYQDREASRTLARLDQGAAKANLSPENRQALATAVSAPQAVQRPDGSTVQLSMAQAYGAFEQAYNDVGRDVGAAYKLSPAQTEQLTAEVARQAVQGDAYVPSDNLPEIVVTAARDPRMGALRQAVVAVIQTTGHVYNAIPEPAKLVFNGIQTFAAGPATVAGTLVAAGAAAGSETVRAALGGVDKLMTVIASLGDAVARDTSYGTIAGETAAGNQATIDQTTGVKVLAGAAIEPHRVCRRLQLLRRWSQYEQEDKHVCAGGPRARCGWHSITSGITRPDGRRWFRFRRRSAAPARAAQTLYLVTARTVVLRRR